MTKAIRSSRGGNALSPAVNAAATVLLALGSLLCLFPLALVLAVSFTPERVIALNGYSILPAALSLEAYAFLFAEPLRIVRAYGITIFTTVTGTAVGLLFISLYAYPLSRRDFRYRRFFTFLVFFTMLFNGGLVPRYLVYTQLLHVKNTLLALILPLLVNGYFLLIMRSFLSTTLPEEALESARIDGAGEFRIFFSIVLPLAKPALASIGLFYTLRYWNDWFLSLIYITNDRIVNLQYLMYRVQLHIEELQNASMQNMSLQAIREMADIPSENVRMAMAIVGIGPVILAYPFFRRYFVQGLTLGSIKG